MAHPTWYYQCGASSAETALPHHCRQTGSSTATPLQTDWHRHSRAALKSALKAPSTAPVARAASAVALPLSLACLPLVVASGSSPPQPSPAHSLTHSTQREPWKRAAHLLQQLRTIRTPLPTPLHHRRATLPPTLADALHPPIYIPYNP
jgi:hypothetical protein